MLGNNYGGDAEAYAAELGALLDELGPIPVVLLTGTRFRTVQDEVNAVIRATGDERPNVRVVDWEARTAEPGAEALLGGDRLHLTEDGRVELAAMITAALGSAPAGSQGECLRSTYNNDSAGSVVGGSGGSPPRAVRPPRRGRRGGRSWRSLRSWPSLQW